MGEIERTIVATGSHDLVLDLAASALRQRDPRVTLASSNVGSLGGLTALRDGLCHLAGSHLLDPESGEYTLPYVERRAARATTSRSMRLVHREQGLIVARRQPARAGRRSAIWFATSLRYVNRQRGAGTRVLLDHELARRSASTRRRWAATSARSTPTWQSAAAVAAGRADCGLGVLAAARAFGVDFVPVAREPYDLVIDRATRESDRLAPLWDLMASSDFRAAVDALGGYDTAEMGERIA